jgi:hypothetical protein
MKLCAFHGIVKHGSKIRHLFTFQAGTLANRRLAGGGIIISVFM